MNHTGQRDDSDDAMVVAYRHDVHKLNGEPHRQASDSFAGVPVNQSVPHGADADAARLSRPSGAPAQTVASHDTRYRLSLLTGERAYDSETVAHSALETAIGELVTTDDPLALHRAWLSSDIAGGFNESVYHPYTSLKYHTLLVAALLANYRSGHGFDELSLIVDEPDDVEPHRTIYASSRFCLRLDIPAAGQPWARLGRRPWQSWAATWSRLTAHPLDVDSDRCDMVLDANLRRIRSWSTALQYIEEFEQWRSTP